VHDRFAGKAVKPVALDTLQLQFLGDRKDTCDLRQFGMKGGVKTRHLRKPGEMLLCEADDRQGRWSMQRREGGSSFSAAQLLNGKATMITERQTLNSIEEASAKVRADEMRLDSALRSASEEAARLRQERLRELRALAQLKFGLIQKGELIQELDVAEQQVKELLDRIRRETGEAETRRQEAADTLQKAESLAHEKAHNYDAAANELHALEQEIAPRVTSDPAWIALKARCDSASSTAGEAEKKRRKPRPAASRRRIPICRTHSLCICGDASSAHRTIHLAFLFAFLTQRSPHLSTIVKRAQITRC
jgi:hypothetical protein